MPPAQPRVTIGLPVRNGQRYLGPALDSLLAQTYRDFEIVICDNASTDDTENICRAYASHDSRVRYIRHPRDIGAAKNFNAAFGYATAPYFKWASCDDLVDPELLSECVAVLDRDPAVVLVHSRTRAIGPDGEPLPQRDGSLHLMSDRPSERLFRLFENLTYCNAQYGVMRTDALRRTALLGAFLGSDLCFLAELSLYGKFYQLPGCHLARRFHPQASSSYTPEMLLEHYGMGRPGIALYYWRHLRENAAAVLRSPLRASEKARALRVVLRRAIWQRSMLAVELTAVVRYLTGRAPHAYLPAWPRSRPTDAGRSEMAKQE